MAKILIKQATLFDFADNFLTHSMVSVLSQNIAIDFPLILCTRTAIRSPATKASALLSKILVLFFSFV